MTTADGVTICDDGVAAATGTAGDVVERRPATPDLATFADPWPGQSTRHGSA